MALIKCPECGRDISDMASSCPSCGYVVKKANSVNENKKKNNIMLICGVIIILAIICVVWYQSDKKDNSSYSNSYYDSYYNYPKTGNEGALAKAKSYLNSSAFSYEGLIEQLEYEGFTETEAKYGVDNCGANWKAQALKKNKVIFEFVSFFV